MLRILLGISLLWGTEAWALKKKEIAPPHAQHTSQGRSAKKSSKVAAKTPSTKASKGNPKKEVEKVAVAAPQEPLRTPQSLPMIATSAKQLILLDYATGQVLLEKNADELMYPSSMTKVLTLCAIFKKIEKMKIPLDNTFPVSEKAWKTGGSKMYVELNSQVPLNALLEGIAVQSGNDACIVATEGLSGSEEAFVDEMNHLAKELGAQKTQFVNSHGLPDSRHLTTARDLGVIAIHLIKDFPDFYYLHGKKEFVYNNIKQQNRNLVLSRGIGCDGIKTGYTEGGGYGMIASAIQNGQRLILVINGLASAKERAEEVVKLLTWGFRSYGNYALFKKGQPLRQVRVALGAVNEVPVTVAEDVVLTVPRASAQETKVTFEYLSPLAAPLDAGKTIGKVIITNPSFETPLEVPVVTTQAVDSAHFFKKISDSLTCLFWGR